MILQCTQRADGKGQRGVHPEALLWWLLHRSTQVILLEVYEKEKENNKGKKELPTDLESEGTCH